MHARLNPLDGKYYGTIIEIGDGPLEGNLIEVWLKSDDWDYDGNEPSDRELTHWNISREEHNRLYHNDPDTTPVDMSGGHYESIDTLRVANIIVDALNLAAEFAPGIPLYGQALSPISNEVWEWPEQASTLGELNARFVKLMASVQK